jgi:N-acetylgalactosamine kinase
MESSSHDKSQKNEIQSSSEELSIVTYPDDLSRLYDDENLSYQTNRYQELINKFSSVYNNEKPCCIVRAPGRVNLIGEHIDYEGFPVLPMAIENDIVIAIGVKSCKTKEISPQELNSTPQSELSEFSISINHFDSSKFKSFNLEKIQPLENIKLITPHDWVNYLIAGFNAVNSFKKNHHLKNQISQINLLVTGNVPTSSGLSSSSALTVASALTFVKVFSLENKISKRELAEATINYERSVGTACGGMDQTISIYAEKNKAKLIEFHPKLLTHTVNLPEEVSFIIANSLTESTKIDTLAFRYNKRVTENKIALAIISKKMKLSRVFETLQELKESLKLNFPELLKIINQHLKDGQYTMEEIKEEFDKLDLDIASILKKIPQYDLVLKSNTHFTLKERLLHVAEEAHRVMEFYKICNNINNENETIFDSENDRIKSLGKLMNLSHLSCQTLYECSSKELDSLVNFALLNKAEGARLTGAGWGGCCVIMVRNENLEFLMEKLKEYFRKIVGEKFDGENIEDYYFKTKASQGASILLM